MSTTYNTLTGDTYDLIARKIYGSVDGAARIQSANPHAPEPLTAGTSIFVPDGPLAVADTTSSAPSDNPDEVAVEIDENRFRHWTSVSIVRSIDAVDTFTMLAPFDPSDRLQQEKFRPFSFKPITITVGGEPLFAGTMVDVLPSLTQDARTVAINGYARAGVLTDCNPPASSYPLEYEDQTLTTIAQSMCAPFGIKTIFEADGGPAFERISSTPDQFVWEYLAGLARQVGLIMRSNIAGDLVFLQSTIGGNPVANLNEGSSPLLTVKPEFKPRGYFSDVTGLEPVLFGLDGATITKHNPFAKGYMRPRTFIVTSIVDGAVQKAVDANFGRMFGSMIRYVVTLNTWRDPQGALWEPNTTIRVRAPSAMIYDSYEFLIKQVVLGRTSKSFEARLILVPLGAYKGEAPKSLPFDSVPFARG